MFGCPSGTSSLQKDEGKIQTSPNYSDSLGRRYLPPRRTSKLPTKRRRKKQKKKRQRGKNAPQLRPPRLSQKKMKGCGISRRSSKPTITSSLPRNSTCRLGQTRPHRGKLSLPPSAPA